MTRANKAIIRSQFITVLLLLGGAVLYGQAEDSKKNFRGMINQLTVGSGVWESVNLSDASDKNSPEKIVFKYKKLKGDSMQLESYAPLAGERDSIIFQNLVFGWDAGTNNVKIIGKDGLGNQLNGEPGKLTPTEISFDLLDPLEKSSPSFLRYNQTVTGNAMNISFFKQRGDKWQFMWQASFTLREK